MGKKQQKKVNVGWLFLAMVLVVTCYMIASARIKNETESLKKQESTEMLALSHLESEKAALDKKIVQAGTDAYIEHLARTQYGFLKPGEIRFEITNPEALFSGEEAVAIEIVEQ